MHTSYGKLLVRAGKSVAAAYVEMGSQLVKGFRFWGLIGYSTALVYCNRLTHKKEEFPVLPPEQAETKLKRVMKLEQIVTDLKAGKSVPCSLSRMEQTYFAHLAIKVYREELEINKFRLGR